MIQTKQFSEQKELNEYLAKTKNKVLDVKLGIIHMFGAADYRYLVVYEVNK